MLKAAVVVITRNQRPFLARSLPMLAAQVGVETPPEIIVVDSGSTDGARELIDATPGVRRLDYTGSAGDRFNYARAYNQGIRAAAPDTDFIVRLSGDAVPADAGWFADDRILPGLARSSGDTNVAVGGSRTRRKNRRPTTRRIADKCCNCRSSPSPGRR